MSLENKIRNAATVAAIDATNTERARILWLIDQSENELRDGFTKKLLIESQRHAAEVKLKIAIGLHIQLRMRIASGVHPCNICKGPTTPARTTCDQCMLTEKKENGSE